MRALVWFKKDLRLTDNPALFHACQQSPDGVAALYIIDTDMWSRHHVAHCQIEFILRGLKVLRADLEKIGVPLIVETVSTQKIPALILSHCEKLQCKLYFNLELELNEQKRDQAVISLLEKHQIKSETYHDQLILPFETIRTRQGGYFKIFTAFKREWLKLYSQQHVKLLAKPTSKKIISLKLSDIPEQLPGIASSVNPDLWCAGESVARKNLKNFIDKKLFLYDQQRDFPALDATSKLSPYLATGMISARECFIRSLEANSCELFSGNQGALAWMSELIWREFYRHILIVVPHVCRNKAYKPETEKLPWCYDEKLLQAWQQGCTGFPIVDAAMRQLNSIGWMHNRLRMIVAMFLSKNLFLDWRLGEQYFAEHLIDFDFASNNGGWQWSASTGTDAVPYFRVFNPERQSERFDPENEFILQYCPEFQDHERYPKPVIDYAASRQRVIAAFKKIS